jgi:hypothetical protein
MDWSCFAEELYVGDWRVEGRDHENQGQVYVAIFSGPKARERAEEYADWKISKEQPRPRLQQGQLTRDPDNIMSRTPLATRD